MSSAPTIPAALLMECEQRDIRLAPRSDGGLEVDAPRNALTSDVLERLRTNKAALLAMLRQMLDTAPDAHTTRTAVVTTPTNPVCRCGSTTWRDFPIHGGQSVRRDCERCGRFIDFPIWHGRVTFLNEQH